MKRDSRGIGHCGMESPERMHSRRQVLATAAGFALSFGSVELVFSQTQAEVLGESELSTKQLETLIGMATLMFPHVALEPRVYRDVVLDFAAAITRGRDNRRRVKEGIGRLGASWLRQSEPERIAALKAIEDTEFFHKVRAATISSLYQDPRSWPVIGYEGSVLEYGGYVNRGFDDIDWLGEDPE